MSRADPGYWLATTGWRHAGQGEDAGPVGTLQTKPTSDDGDLLAALAAGGDLNDFLADLVRLAADHTPTAEACGLTLARSSGAVTVSATGPLAQQADERQYDLDTG